MNLMLAIKSILLAIIILCAFPVRDSSALAEDQAARLERAIVDWLEDRDEFALPALSDIANAGNEDAMMLLARIADRGGRQSPFLASLEIRERNRLLKAPGGLSGKSWLSRVVANQRLAKALQTIGSGGLTIDDLRVLEKAGLRAQFLQAILRRGEAELYESAPLAAITTDWPEEATYLKVILSMGVSRLPVAPAQRSAAFAVLETAEKELRQRPLQGYLVFGRYYVAANPLAIAVQMQISGNEIPIGSLSAVGMSVSEQRAFTARVTAQRENAAEIVADLVFRSPETLRLVAHCGKLCPQSVKACAFTWFRTLGGYQDFLKIQTPLDSAASPDRYFSSPRYLADLLRNVGDGLDPFFYTREKLFRRLGKDADACIVDRIVNFR